MLLFFKPIYPDFILYFLCNINTYSISFTTSSLWLEAFIIAFYFNHTLFLMKQECRFANQPLTDG